MGKTLTAELILLRAKTDRLSNIKNLNLWGNELDNVAVLREMTNVEVLSLSVNKISTLKDFQSCTKLTELYLRKNAIQDLREVNFLANLKYLRVLWLWDNPCSEHPLYRAFIISKIPNLMKLDNTAITPEERQQALQNNFGDLSVTPVSKDQQQQQSSNQNGYGAAVAAAAAAHHREDHRSARHSEQVVQRPPPPQMQHQPRAYEIQPKEVKRQGWQKRAAPPEAYPNSSPPPPASQMNGAPASQSSRNENILCAVLSLLKELDHKGLELVRRDIDRKLGKE